MHPNNTGNTRPRYSSGRSRRFYSRKYIPFRSQNKLIPIKRNSGNNKNATKNKTNKNRTSNFNLHFREEKLKHNHTNTQPKQ
jgi:hypothetical protein